MSGTDLLIEMQAVGARIGAATILRSVDLSVGPGEAVGLFGGNGAGKTTLLRVIATLLVPSSGSGRVLGRDLAGNGRFDVRARIGMIGHTPALYPELSLEENLRFAAEIRGVPAESVVAALDQVGLGDVAGRRADRCSFGMQRRAEFARELMLGPELLLLDEPHTALDPDAVELVSHLARSVTSRGGAVVAVSHDRDRIAPMVSRTTELMAGSLA